MPKKHADRPFWISDAVVLVAASAFGLSFRPSEHWVDSELIPVAWTPDRIRNGLLAWADELAPTLGAWTLALALLSLRSPRPRPLARQPGVAVAWAASIGVLVHLLEVGVLAAKAWLGWGAFYYRVDHHLYAVHYAVRLLLSERAVQPPAAAALAALALHALGGRRWHATGWLNRAGLLVGACWIALLFVLLCL